MKVTSDDKRVKSNFFRDKDMWLKQVFKDRKLTATEKNIAWAISYHLNSQTRQGWPGHAVLSEMCGVGYRTSQYATSALEKAGYLRISRRANCANRYEMALPKGTARDCGTPPHGVAVPPAPHCGTPPHGAAPEPLNITSDRTTDRTLSKREDKVNGSGEVGERAPAGPKSELVSGYLAQQIKQKYFQ